MPEAYRHDGSAWRKAKEWFRHDGTAWRKCKERWRHDGTAWRLVFSGFTPGLTGGGTLYSDVDGNTSSTVALTAQTNGSLTVVGGSVNSTLQWGAPTTSSIGVGYWVRFTLTASSNSGTGG